MGWRYAELEAALAWGCNLDAWERFPAHIRAEMLSHYLLKGRLDGYIRAKAKAKAERESGKPNAPTDAPSWSRFGGGSKHGVEHHPPP
jgi:hypothetical protein